MPALGAMQDGLGNPSFENVVSGCDWRSRRTRAELFPSPAMTGRQLGGQHTVAFLNKMTAFSDWNFLPAIPINLTIRHKNGIKAGFVEWDVLLCVPEQVCKLIALEREHLIWRPELAFHKHIEDFFSKNFHAGISQTMR
ncbi:MAG: hypothetical protein Q8L53_15890 [Aestuariivirga sp.]|nr:hypothetical protein [Aestuariivirga sp.]